MGHSVQNLLLLGVALLSVRVSAAQHLLGKRADQLLAKRIESKGYEPVVFNEFMGNATFDQLLDHDASNSSTFPQRYWWNREFWDGPGSPVLLVIGGEITGALNIVELTDGGTIYSLAQEFNAMIVILERKSALSRSKFTHLRL